MTTDSVGYRSAAQLRAAFAAGAMAPADVVAELLDRAGGMDAATSGVTELDPRGAHAAAVDSGRRYRSGGARARTRCTPRGGHQPRISRRGSSIGNAA